MMMPFLVTVGIASLILTAKLGAGVKYEIMVRVLTRIAASCAVWAVCCVANPASCADCDACLAASAVSCADWAVSCADCVFWVAIIALSCSWICDSVCGIENQDILSASSRGGNQN